MSSAISELLAAISGAPKEDIKIVTGIASTADPLAIEIGGAQIKDYEINCDIEPESGDRLLCLIYDGSVYVICRLGGAEN